MKTKKALCPVLPNVLCPRGSKAAQECFKQLQRNFDPAANINDFLILNCAIAQAQTWRIQHQK